MDGFRFATPVKVRFAETVRDTLAWAQANPDQSTSANWGLPPEREQELLDAWFASQA